MGSNGGSTGRLFLRCCPHFHYPRRHRHLKVEWGQHTALKMALMGVCEFLSPERGGGADGLLPPVDQSWFQSRAIWGWTLLVLVGAESDGFTALDPGSPG